MAVRVRVRISRASRSKTPPVETVAVANSGFEAREPEALLPARVAERLGLWPPPAHARVERFESPAASFSMVAVPHALRVSIAGASRRGAVCHAVVSERETEVVLSDRLLDLLAIVLINPGRGIYRIGPRGRLRQTERPETW